MKKVFKAILAGAVFLCLGTVCFASGLENKNAIGIYVIGSESPVGGIQYERRFSDLFSTKFGTYVLVKGNNSYTSVPVEFNFVIEPDFCLYKTEWNSKVSSRLFAFGLAGYDFKETADWEYDETLRQTVLKETDTSHGIIAGAGFGFEFIFFGHLSIPVQFGFTGLIDKEPFFGFGGGIAVRYSW